MDLKTFIDLLEQHHMPYFVQGHHSRHTYLKVPTQKGTVRFTFKISGSLNPDTPPLNGTESIIFLWRYSTITGNFLRSQKVGERFLETLQLGRVGFFRKNGDFDRPRLRHNGLLTNY